MGYDEKSVYILIQCFMISSIFGTLSCRFFANSSHELILLVMQVEDIRTNDVLGMCGASSCE